MPSLGEVLGDYLRLLPTRTVEEVPRYFRFTRLEEKKPDPQQEVWNQFHDTFNLKLIDLGRLRMYHADRARSPRTPVERAGRMAKAENCWNRAYELLEGLLAQILVVADAVPVSEFSGASWEPEVAKRVRELPVRVQCLRIDRTLNELQEEMLVGANDKLSSPPARWVKHMPEEYKLEFEECAVLRSIIKGYCGKKCKGEKLEEYAEALEYFDVHLAEMMLIYAPAVCKKEMVCGDEIEKRKEAAKQKVVEDAEREERMKFEDVQTPQDSWRQMERDNEEILVEKKKREREKRRQRRLKMTEEQKLEEQNQKDEAYKEKEQKKCEKRQKNLLQKEQRKGQKKQEKLLQKERRPKQKKLKQKKPWGPGR